MTMEIIYNTNYENGREICHSFKDGDITAIKKMALDMSRIVPKDVVLVPIPSRYGYATTTLILAKEIAKISNSPVADILKGFCRQSNYLSKKEGHPLTIDDLGFHKIQSTDLTPCFIDNVYDTGITMLSAYNAFGKGIGLVYSMVLP